MLLRRISLHLKRQDWFAVFLDFIIVVSGIFIGMQVTDWNSSRVDAKHEQQYLQQLQREFSLSVETNESYISSLEEWLNLHVNAIKILERGTLEDNDRQALSLSFQILMATAVPPYMQTETIEDLASSGRFAVLKNKELVYKIKGALNNYRTMQKHYSAMELRSYSKASYLDGKFAVEMHEEAQYHFDDYDYQALSKDKEFIRHVKNAAIIAQLNIYWIGGVLEAQIEVLKLLEEELEKH